MNRKTQFGMTTRRGFLAGAATAGLVAMAHPRAAWSQAGQIVGTG